MPLHDWTRVPAGLLHDFHQSWCVRIKDALNAGRLPRGVSALVEQRSGPRESDVLAIEGRSKPLELSGGGGSVATVEKPVTRFMQRSAKGFYADRANRILVKLHLGRIIAVIEIVSPGNKDSRHALREFVEKTLDFLKGGIHVLVVDLFPPTPRDPAGIHQVIWNEIDDGIFALPPGKDRILASYETGNVRACYVEAVGVGDTLIEMPLFLANDYHVKVPLEATYQTTWAASPEDLRQAVETGILPTDEDAD